MNINFHYFVVKTLAIEAGLDESVAQLLALTSQMVDDVTPNLFKGESVPSAEGKMLKICVKRKPPQYFQRNSMTGYCGQNFYEFYPSITGFGLMDARDEFYQKESVIPFHFYVDQYGSNPADRRDLRTKPAVKGTPLYLKVDAVVDRILNNWMANPNERDKDLVQLGVLLHVFADTFAHAGFSGEHGWENNARIVEIFDSASHVVGRSGLEHFTDRLGNITNCGHGQLAHLPDVCGAVYWYRSQEQEDGECTVDVCRANRNVFELCAKYIFAWFMRLSGNQQLTDSRWDAIKGRLMDTACLVRGEQDDVEHADELAEIWAKNYFNNISRVSHFKYDTEALFGQSICGSVGGKPVYRFRNEELFYLFQEVTYEFRKFVMGKY